MRIFSALVGYVWLLMSGMIPAQSPGFDFQRDFESIQKQSQIENHPLNYQNLYKRFQAIDNTLTDFEVLALIIGFTKMDSIHQMADEFNLSELQTELKSKDWGKALEGFSKAIKLFPFNMEVLKISSFVFQKSGKMASFYKSDWQWRKIRSAMKFSGDGKSLDRPIMALSFTNMVIYIDSQPGLQSIGLVEANGQGKYPISQVAVLDIRSGEMIDHYFWIYHRPND